LGLLVAQAATPLMKDWVLVIGAPAAQVPLLLPLPQLLPLLPLLRTLLLLLLLPLQRKTGCCAEQDEVVVVVAAGTSAAAAGAAAGTTAGTAAAALASLAGGERQPAARDTPGMPLVSLAIALVNSATCASRAQVASWKFPASFSFKSFSVASTASRVTLCSSSDRPDALSVSRDSTFSIEPH
jgi:hypothetical protein